MTTPFTEEQARSERRKTLVDRGSNPYPARVQRTHTFLQIEEQFAALMKSQKSVTLVGRVRRLRFHGGSSFGWVEDQSGGMQFFLRKDTMGERTYAEVKQSLDIGDFVEIEGTCFLTKTKEKTILVSSYRMISKAILPLPDKWHGLADVEIRFRKRYLDLLSNPEVKQLFKIRSAMMIALKNFLEQQGFLEVETPILQTLPGGATARPFVTHHHALDIDLYLRVAPELYLKRLLVGGFERVYEIARCFRNEGIDYAHNPEFTQVEFYAAYMDYHELMKFTEKMIPHIVKASVGTLDVKYGDHMLHFKPPYPRLPFREGIKQYTKIDIDTLTDRDALADVVKKFGVRVDQSDGRGKILDELYKKKVRPHLIQPTFLVDHPIELSPLAKKKEKDERYVERFQLVVGGQIELCNAFSELNDPIDQEQRFQAQEQLRKKGDLEAQPYDQDFVEALKYGMPPAAGFGMGLDRFTTLLTNTHSVKEVILFPTLRPKS